MQKKLKVNISKATAGQVGRQIGWAVRRLPHFILLEHLPLFAAVIMAVGMAVAVWALVVVFFTMPMTDEAMNGRAPVALNVGTIDKLEFWIEEVQREQEAGFLFPARSIFVVEDVKLEE